MVGDDEKTRRLVRETVKETLLLLGLDTKDPTRVQAMFSFLDALHRDWRTIKRTAICTVVGIVITAIAGATWSGMTLKIVKAEAVAEDARN